MKIIELKINDTLITGVPTVSLVELPATETDFFAFNNQNHFSLYENISFDFDGVLTTAAGRELAKEEIAKGNHVYIISARENKESMLDIANELGIPDQNVFAAKNNVQKIAKIQSLNIDRHYDDNADVVNKIIGIGHKFNAEEFILNKLIEMEIDVTSLPNYTNEIPKKNKFAAQLADKQMLIGPLMIPNKLIPRIDEKTKEEYQVFFTKDTIEQIAHKMMISKSTDSINIEHDDKQLVNDVYLVETWIVKDPNKDKSSLYGFSASEGDWYGIYKVNNPDVWYNYIKTNKVKGFSVEGYFLNNILTKK